MEKKPILIIAILVFITGLAITIAGIYIFFFFVAIGVFYFITKRVLYEISNNELYKKLIKKFKEN